MRIGIIDLGTNSARLDVYNVEKKEKPERIHREKQMVRLGQGLFDRGEIDPRAIGRTISVFEDFEETLEELEVAKTIAFATSALRDAPNRNLIIQKIEEVSGIRLKVISGNEEARLIAQGILKREKLPSGNFALIDIGGGSTEISLCRGAEILFSSSLNLGALRLQQQFLKESPPRSTRDQPDPVGAFRDHVRKNLIPVLEKEQRFKKCEIALGSSGTIRAIKKILKKTFNEDNDFKRKSLRRMIESLLPLNYRQIENFPGMDEKRKDIILSGALLLDEILEVLEIKEVLVTEFSLREGMLDEILEKLALT